MSIKASTPLEKLLLLKDTLQMAEEDGIQLVLARATELRLKVANCINSVTASAVVIKKQEFGGEAKDLLNICSALEALESQLSSLQILQRNQQYEREAALAEIDSSRRVLLDQLKDYVGADMELIWEASAFAGQTVDHGNNDRFSSSYRVMRNGKHRTANSINEPSRNTTRRLLHLMGGAAKAAFTLVGIISLLSYGNIPIMKSMSRRRSCMVENGLVKERVAVPFGSFVETSDIDYGCG